MKLNLNTFVKAYNISDWETENPSISNIGFKNANCFVHGV